MTPRQMLKIATIERARWWLNIDAPLCHRVEHDKGLTPESVTEIARLYNVRRTLGPTAGLAEVASHLNKVIQNCPNDLPRRAQMCLQSAEYLKKKLALHHTPHSAVTKLVWFLRPAGWTVYDSYARQAVRSGGQTGYSRAHGFYVRLEQEGFIPAAQKVEEILENTVWSGLSGVRVLDAFLMLKGGFPFMLRNGAARQGFIGGLPDDSGIALDEIADKIATDLANCQFVKYVTED